jgi:hypothetical protein
MNSFYNQLSAHWSSNLFFTVVGTVCGFVLTGAVGKSFTDLSNAERWIEQSLATSSGGASPGVPRA